MTNAPRFVVVSILTGAAIVAASHDAATRQPRSIVPVSAGYAADADALRRWDVKIDGMARAGELVVTWRADDRSVPGRTHEYLAQYVGGVPVYGGGVSRQLDAAGVTLSLSGTLHQGLAVDTAPALSGAEVAALLEELQDGKIVAGGQPSLGVLPLPDDSYALAYSVVMSDGYFYFADADDGRVLRRARAAMSQSAVGAGAGSLGDDRKLSTTRSGDRFEARDGLRPAEIVTLDLRFNDLRRQRLTFEHFFDQLPPGEAVWTADDVAADADNDWDDPAVVDGHGYTGWTYDYFFDRHGWEGVDGENGRIVLMVNDTARNASFWPPPFGPEGAGVLVYGRAIEDTGEEPFTSLDIVAHEQMHGVTHYAVSNRTGDPRGLVTSFPDSARLGPESFTTGDGTTYTCETARFPGDILTEDGRLEVGLVPAWCVEGRFVLAASQGGAVHEAYSDIFGESLGFFYEDEGATADYQVGGDHDFGPVRSLSDPKSVRDGFHPDAYRDRYEFALTLNEALGWDYSGFLFVGGRYFGRFRDGFFGYGGEHWNSLILSHAFYLSIEGGTHGTSGATVAGVGDANRAEMERIFFRAMSDLMPAATALPIAAAVIRQSAADLAAGGDAQRAVDEALSAVGLPPPAGF